MIMKLEKPGEEINEIFQILLNFRIFCWSSKEALWSKAEFTLSSGFSWKDPFVLQPTANKQYDTDKLYSSQGKKGKEKENHSK